MATAERLRIEIAFEGNQVLSLLVVPAVADDLDRALGGGGDTTFAFEADDGRYTLLLRRVVYVKRFVRESRVGFGSNG
jgi:hypothetical protein